MTYIFATSIDQAQLMLTEVASELSELGLSLNLAKVKWLANRWAEVDDNSFVTFQNVKIPRSDNIVVLGSTISGNMDESPAIEHRVTKAWACFHRWSHILLGTGSLGSRLRFWERTVGASLLWGVSTLRSHTANGVFSKLLTCQRQQVRRMTKIKRCPIGPDQLEPWVQWQIRSYGIVMRIIDKYNINVFYKAQELKRRWAGHLIRYGRFHPTNHLVKAIVLWRPKAWWLDQDIYNSLFWDPVFHPATLGRPMRWEDGFSSNWPLVLYKH